MEAIDKVSPAAQPAGFLGAIDDDRGGRISGWAVTREGDPCTVTLTVNDQSFSTESDLPRPDLAAKQQARGKGGWRIALDAALAPGENRVEVFLPDGTPLAGSPRIVAGPQGGESITPAAPGYLGAIDTANPARLSGWALTALGEPCLVGISLNDAPSVAILSEAPRPDLTAKGMSTGGGGWHLALAGWLVLGTNRVSVTLPDGSHLPGSPLVLEGPVIASEPPVAHSPVAMAPKARATVTELPQRQRAAMPSIAELDELSLDDLALAVASGRIQVDAPPAPLPVPPIETVESATAAPQPAPRTWLRRVWRR